MGVLREKHIGHNTDIVYVDDGGPHYAKIICHTCGDKFVSWASKDEIVHILKRITSTVDLQVPYIEKDQAKKLGAKWDVQRKIWYTDLYNPKLKDLVSNGWLTQKSIAKYERLNNTPFPIDK